MHLLSNGDRFSMQRHFKIIPGLRLPDRCPSVASIRALPGMLLALGLLATGPVTAAEKVQFNRDIRPILSDNCFFCHGPDMNQRKADLRLDMRDEAIAYTALVPGKPHESLLVERINSDDAELMMPPPESNKTLTAEQKELLTRWIADGAEYEGHWAYQPPVKPEVPAGANGIDHLVAQRLTSLSLTPASEADRRVLARRLYSDLIGLPPTPDEVAAFINDSAPDAYERLVEKLLASPHYGERMAIPWLDVVRFADTMGYHSDNPRNVWPYRDYVIRAFNTNMPFDRFTVENLAGDLLPESTDEQKVASAFNRLLLTTEEGGAQAKDYEARMLTDRVRAVGAVWLGQTIGCAQCHDHKFDPITSRDFYSLGAFFADIQEPIIGRPEPGMIVASDEQKQELARLQKTAAELDAQLQASSPELTAAQAEWEQAVRTAMTQDVWSVLHPELMESEKGSQFKVEEGEVIVAHGTPQGGIDTYRITVKTKLVGITGFRLETLPDPSLPSNGPGRASNGNFVLSEFGVTDGAGQPIKLAHASASFEQKGFPAERTIDGKVEPGNGWAVMGHTGEENTIAFELAETAGKGDELSLVFILQQPYGSSHLIGRFRLSATTAPKPIRAEGAGLPPQEIVEIIKRDAAEPDEAQRQKLAAHFRSITPLLADLRGSIEMAKKVATDYENGLPRCLTSISMAMPRTVRILPRGDWLNESGPVVQPALPHFLPQPEFPGDRRLTRLDLANWIVARENPLTARVFVNRLWKQFFGVGLSKTADDLGAQGEWPVHPELLDWLAWEFMDSGWDVKHMVRTIVLSRTYRQASTASKELLARDPENRLLARQSRWRADAELVRDNALAVSGLLVPKIGGPSVKPYQPDGYWENLNFPPRTYDASNGADQYRRGMYTWWQRSFVHPSMLALDAPTREECTADRTRSNIPQQALVLLNDPTYVEAARAFAARILKECDGDAEARIAWAWQQALQRAPRDEERQVARALVEKHRQQYAANTAAAESLLKVGYSPMPEGLEPAELAAWTNVARVILNLHESITRN